MFIAESGGDFSWRRIAANRFAFAWQMPVLARRTSDAFTGTRSDAMSKEWGIFIADKTVGDFCFRSVIFRSRKESAAESIDFRVGEIYIQVLCEKLFGGHSGNRLCVGR